nr:DUF3251 domain-containing protein [Sodalis-like endosymbiont of Proechinophthirus fluctus]
MSSRSAVSTEEKTAGNMQSETGKLRLSILSDRGGEASRSRAKLYIYSTGGAVLMPLPVPLHGIVYWGQVDATGKPLTADVLTQPISVPSYILHPTSSLLPRTEATIELRMSGLTTEER